MSAIKATAYTFPIILALTIHSFAAFHGGGHIGGFLGGGAFRAGGLTMASEAGAVVSFAAVNGGFAALTNMKLVSAPFTTRSVK
jgi:hypothetical protein